MGGAARSIEEGRDDRKYPANKGGERFLWTGDVPLGIWLRIAVTKAPKQCVGLMVRDDDDQRAI